MPLEKDVTTQVKEALDQLKQNHPLWYWKVHGHHGQLAGVPDFHIVFYGQSVHAELKRDETKEASPIQKKRIKEIKQASGVAFVAHDVETVVDQLARVLDRIQDLKVCQSCFALLHAEEVACQWCDCEKFYFVKEELGFNEIH